MNVLVSIFGLFPDLRYVTTKQKQGVSKRTRFVNYVSCRFNAHSWITPRIQRRQTSFSMPQTTIFHAPTCSLNGNTFHPKLQFSSLVNIMVNKEHTHLFCLGKCGRRFSITVTVIYEEVRRESVNTSVRQPLFRKSFPSADAQTACVRDRFRVPRGFYLDTVDWST